VERPGGATSTTRIERLLLTEVEFPEWHPRSVEGGCPVFGYAVIHPDGVILFDTGVGTGNPFIDELYRPRIMPIDSALAAVGVDEREVVAVVNSHLHFDHCGQNETFYRHGVPVYVHSTEVTAAETLPHYTIPEWARVPDLHLRKVKGDERLTEGVMIIETPGHTPGHQSLVVETSSGRTVLAGQCVYHLVEVAERKVAPDNMHDDEFGIAGQRSLERLLAFHPCSILVAHDRGCCTV
jgi:N-acyl homoserine lactone hydrolase